MKKEGVHLYIQDMMLFLTWLNVCLTGHKGIGSVISVLNYSIYGLLLIAIIFQKQKLEKEQIVFFILSGFAVLLNLLYNVFGNRPHFSMISDIRAFVFYIGFAYCGFYLAKKFSGTEKIYNSLHVISLAAIIIATTQFLSKYIAGVYLNRIPGIGNYLFHAVDTSRYFRPCAFFSEPSYMAEIVLLDLWLNLYVRKNLKMAVCDCIGLIVSTSSMGIVFAFALIVWWVLTNNTMNNKLLNIVAKVLLSCALFIVLTSFLAYDGSNAIINRILKGATISQRTLRSFEIYGRMTTLERIFGIGMQNLSNYLNYYGVRLVNEGIDTLVNREFAQSFGYVLCTLGLLGVMGYIVLLIVPFAKLKRSTNGIAVLFVLFSLTSNLITRQFFALLIAFIWTEIYRETGGRSKDILKDENTFC